MGGREVEAARHAVLEHACWRIVVGEMGLHNDSLSQRIRALRKQANTPVEAGFPSQTL